MKKILITLAVSLAPALFAASPSFPQVTNIANYRIAHSGLVTNNTAGAVSIATNSTLTASNIVATGTFTGNGSGLTGVKVADTNITGTITVNPTNGFVGFNDPAPSNSLSIYNAGSASIKLRTSTAGSMATPIPSGVTVYDNVGNILGQTVVLDARSDIFGGQYVIKLTDNSGVLQTRFYIDYTGAVTVSNTVTAKGFATTGTYNTTVGATGYTNSQAFDVRAFELKGTGIFFSNSVIPLIINLGTLSVNNDFMVLHPSESVFGTGMSGVIIQ